jgi:Do/DeqQ family serine protease
MRTHRFSSLLIAALLGGLVSVISYSKFFDNKQVLYQNPFQNARLAAYSGTSDQPVDLTYAAQLTVPAVVHVRTKSKIETTYSNPLYDFFYGNGSITRSEPVIGFGSGVIISPDGFIVTNNHVIKGAENISVTLNDNREFDAQLIATDPSTDIALLKIDAKNLAFIPFGNSDDMKLGEWVLAVGNPYNLTSTVTAGIISARARNLDILTGNYKIESFLQTDAALNPGNSGGALVNVKGELIGITTAIMSPTGGFSGNSFAVPSSIVKKVISDLKSYGKVQRAILGITPIDVNAEVAKQHNLSITEGVYISDIRNDGAARDAGLKEGDVIIKLGSIPTENTSRLQEELSKFSPNDKVSVTVLRDNKELTYNVILKSLENESKVANSSGDITIMGAKFSELSTDEKQKLGIKYGVKISELRSGKFSKAGVEEGFIITRMNNNEVNSVNDVKNILNNTHGGLYIEGIYPNGVIAYYAFGL